MTSSWTSFADEMMKIARVHRAVKDYRRAYQGYTEALDSIDREDILNRVRNKGFALHGTRDASQLPRIIDEGRLRASTIGDSAHHGTGAYFWEGLQRERYLRGPGDEGILTDLASIPNKQPKTRSVFDRSKIDHWALVSGPGDYKLRTGKGHAPKPEPYKTPTNAELKERLLAKRQAGPQAATRTVPPDTMVVDMATRSKNKTLKNLLADAAERRVRTMDTSTLHTALRQAKDSFAKRRRAGGGLLPPPSKMALIKNHARRLAGAMV